MQSAAPSAFGAAALFSYHLSNLATITAADCCEGGVIMNRVKAACILQTLVFAQKEDCGLSHNSILKPTAVSSKTTSRLWIELIPVIRLLAVMSRKMVPSSSMFESSITAKQM